MATTLKLSLVLFLLGFHCSSGEKLSRLENLISGLSNKFGDFVSLVDSITHILNRMEENAILNDLIAKCREHVNNRNEIGLLKIWQQILKNHNKTTELLNRIIIDSYSGKRENILTLIRFIGKTNKCSGYETLLAQMNDYGHFFDGGEIFSLGSSILHNCNHTLFEKLPHAVQLVFTKNVSLQNTFNKGYLFRKMNVKEHGLENHIATIKITPPPESEFEDTKVNTSDASAASSTPHIDLWRFVPASDNAETFTIKNRNSVLKVSPSRRIYFAPASQVSEGSGAGATKFKLEMNRREEICLGLDLDTAGGKKFYRLYVLKTKLKGGDIFELNLWTISPKDEYHKLIYWTLQEEE